MGTIDRIALGMVLAATVTIAVFSALNYMLLRGGVLDVREVSPVETVKVSEITGGVLDVREVKPVKTVRVSEITTVVQVAVPKNAELYGYCFKDSGPGEGYNVSITAITGGVEQTVAKGNYTRGAAESIAQYAASYFDVPGGELTFGESSSECSDLQGWYNAAGLE